MFKVENRPEYLTVSTYCYVASARYTDFCLESFYRTKRSIVIFESDTFAVSTWPTSEVLPCTRYTCTKRILKKIFSSMQIKNSNRPENFTIRQCLDGNPDENLLDDDNYLFSPSPQQPLRDGVQIRWPV